jgi:hypothetical protein
MNDQNLNKELYSGKLFNIWSKKCGLLPTEKYLLNKYLLNKQAKIIEAGTGGGRIIFEIEKLGFTKLEAFDFVENMITFCKEKKRKFSSNIKFRVIRNEKKVKHQLPWLIINGKFNWKFLNSNQPQNLWFKKENIIKILNDNGFNIIEIITGENILNKHNSKSGHLYIVCKKNNL